ncbi:MAG: hypothetical protein FWE63_07620, partial [Bacteroidales bacterium]|nr:hypothetical protein [Bacteroidales bacterium]
MQHFLSKFLFFILILLAYRSEAHHQHSHPDTLIHGTRSRPNGERLLRESMVLSSEKHLQIKGFSDYQPDTADENTVGNVVLRVA